VFSISGRRGIAERGEGEGGVGGGSCFFSEIATVNLMNGAGAGALSFWKWNGGTAS